MVGAVSAVRSEPHRVIPPVVTVAMAAMVVVASLVKGLVLAVWVALVVLVVSGMARVVLVVMVVLAVSA